MWDAFGQVIGACLAKLLILGVLVSIIGVVVVLAVVCG